MKNILNINQKIRLVPDNFIEMTQGVITAIGLTDFTVKLENNESADKIFGKHVELNLTTQHCLIKFKTLIKNKTDNFIKIEIPDDYQKIQRREYTRVDVKLPVKCLYANSTFDAQTVNLSGGGMKIISPLIFEAGNILEVKIQLRRNKFVNSRFEILRSEQKKDDNIFFLSGVFKKISNPDRIAIVQLCFKRQLELRCKGLSDIKPKGGKY